MQSVLSPLARELDDLSLFRTATPFDRRVTALDWHPTNPEVVVAGSKGGDIILWNTLHLSLDQFIQGVRTCWVIENLYQRENLYQHEIFYQHENFYQYIDLGRAFCSEIGSFCLKNKSGIFVNGIIYDNETKERTFLFLLVLI